MSKYNEQYRIESNRMPGWDYSRNGYYFITPVIQNMKWILGKVKDGEMILSDFGKIVNEEWYKSFEIRNELILDDFVIMPNHLHAILIIKHPDNALKKFPGLPYNTNDPALSALNDFDENEYFDDHLNEFPNRNENFDEIGNEKSDLNGEIKSDLNGEIKSDLNGKVQTHGRASLHSLHSPHSPHSPHSLHSPHPMPQRPPHSISSFMAGFKSATTTKIDDFIDLHHLSIPKYNKNNRLWQLNYNDRIIRDDAGYWRIKNYIKNNPIKWDKDKFHS